MKLSDAKLPSRCPVFGEAKKIQLTDDDLDVINGRRDQLEGRLQERYGYAKDQARKDVDDWFNTIP